MTSAADTEFCAEKIEGPGGHLWVDGNGKITAGNGTLLEPKPNAFSLVQIETCPMRTPSCEKACYVHNLEKHAPETHDLYKHNTEMIQSILDMGDPDISDWVNTFASWMDENTAGRDFRWHVSGDVFSERYAWFIATVCRYASSTNHWIYTRSFPLINPLLHVDNLELNLSADKDNLWLALHYHNETGKRVCYLAAEPDSEAGWGKLAADISLLPDDSVIFPDYPLRGKGRLWDGLTPRERKMLCPVDAFGKSETNRCGPCTRCLKR